MRLSILGLFVFTILAFTSCQKESGKMTDAQLIDAIQKASNKQNIEVAELPSASIMALNEEYSEDYVDAAKLAPKLGYEVDMRKGTVSRKGERSQAYFDLDGRMLRGDKDKIDGDKDENSDNDKRRCFKLIYPVTYIMLDGTEILVASNDEAGWAEVKAWYAAHPDVAKRPAIKFPVDIKWKDGTIFTINSKEEMRAAKAKCAGDKVRCFELVLPVTYTMPDESTITVENKEDFGLLKTWYEENPGFDGKPVLQFPVDIKWKDGTIVTINSKEEMRAAKAKCDGDKVRCFHLVLPVTYTMPDESTITVENKEDFRQLKTWYEENPGFDARPELQFPVDIKWKDGTIETIINIEEMKAARAKCGDDKHD